jgi:hypothetical protein
MSAMAKLRPHVDAFFEKVTVNVDEAPVRANRLKLLNQVRIATRTVADFSKIEGYSLSSPSPSSGRVDAEGGRVGSLPQAP